MSLTLKRGVPAQCDRQQGFEKILVAAWDTWNTSLQLDPALTRRKFWIHVCPYASTGSSKIPFSVEWKRNSSVIMREEYVYFPGGLVAGAFYPSIDTVASTAGAPDGITFCANAGGTVVVTVYPMEFDPIVADELVIKGAPGVNTGLVSQVGCFYRLLSFAPF